MCDLATCDPVGLALTVCMLAAGLAAIGIGTFAAMLMLIRRFM